MALASANKRCALRYLAVISIFLKKRIVSLPILDKLIYAPAK
jgi:hypothetical protein